MSVKELKEGIEEGKVFFGIKQALKLGARKGVPSKVGTGVPVSSGKELRVFIAKDTRDESVERLEGAGIEFDVLKSRADLTKELNLDFECEVFSLHQGIPHKGAK